MGYWLHIDWWTLCKLNYQWQETCNNCFGLEKHNTTLRQMKISKLDYCKWLLFLAAIIRNGPFAPFCKLFIKSFYLPHLLLCYSAAKQFILWRKNLPVLANERLYYIFPTPKNCCKFLACDSVNLRNIHQSFFQNTTFMLFLLQ